MNTLRIGIIKEGKTPPDSRVPFSPRQCKALLAQYPSLAIYVAPSPHRCFADEEYSAQGIALSDDLSHCDVLMGVKEVPDALLIPHKKYFFFSHTIKKQAYNKHLLRTLLDKQIEMLDYECLVYDNETRILGFGHFAGIVGAHNGLLLYGKKTGTFDLLPAHQSHDYQQIKHAYSTLQLPPMRIVLTGTGRVSQGAKEVLDELKIKQLSPEAYLRNEPSQEPVYVQLTSADLYRRPKTNDANADEYYERYDFHHHPEHYHSIFLPYTRISDLMINGVYWNPKAPLFFSKADMRHPDFRIRAIADITCDIDGSIPATTRATTIDNPIMGYNPQTEQEEKPYQAHTIDIMSVDNLPNELPRDASEMFGNALIQHVIPELFKSQSAILERAAIVKNGELMPRFSYLSDWVNDLE
jgi:saccharopine dehydrogenase (NAD+, L-lysine-forming)